MNPRNLLFAPSLDRSLEKAILLNAVAIYIASVAFGVVASWLISFLIPFDLAQAVTWVLVMAVAIIVLVAQRFSLLLSSIIGSAAANLYNSTYEYYVAELSDWTAIVITLVSFWVVIRFYSEGPMPVQPAGPKRRV